MAKNSLDLTGKWQFKEYPLTARRMRDLEDSDWFDCSCPNSIFINLVEAGQIEQEQIYANPEDFKWVSEKHWIYRKVFDANEELLQSGEIDLVFDGLDTVASVWLNEKLIGKCENMFVEHRFDVTKYLKETNNVLMVKFSPAVEHAKKQMDRHTEFSEEQFLNPYRAYIRKAQYQFGWDFCPLLPGCGIFRNVRLEGISKAHIENLHIRTIHCNDKSADIRVAVRLKAISHAKLNCSLKIYDQENNIAASLEFEPHGSSGSTVFHINEPLLWWPNGYGKANLYKYRLQLLTGDEILDIRQGEFGIRTIELNREADKAGSKFQFLINGQKVYVRGANWIPTSIFAGSTKERDYEKLVSAAAEANMNMLRVWAGGYYEDNKFYKLCDKHGIMVWQDFMFACCYYPDRQWFLDEIKKEARDVIERLYNHPSLVLWCGNNECQWIHYKSTNGSGKRLHGKKIWEKLLPKLVSEMDPDRPYIPTTPFSDLKDPNNNNSGTTHNWSVWSGHKPMIDYITAPSLIPRFVTEFGLQSLPNIKTITKSCQSEKLKLAGRELEKHNYQVDGNSRLHRYCCDLFGPVRDLEQLIYFSQLTQARAVKSYVEYLRAHNYRNYGAMFWQLNDCFSSVSFSAIDHFNNAKAVYYYARQSYAPIITTIVPEYDRSKIGIKPELLTLGASVINDTTEPVTGRVICGLKDLYGNQLDKVELPITVMPFSCARPIQLSKSLVSPEHPEKSFLQIMLEIEGQIKSENSFFYLPDKYIKWPQPKLTYEIHKLDEHNCLLTIKSDVFAKDVVIDTGNDIFPSDNYIDIVGGTNKQIKMAINRPFDTTEKMVSLSSLAEILGE